MDVFVVFQTWFQTGEDWWNAMTIAIEIFIRWQVPKWVWYHRRRGESLWKCECHWGWLDGVGLLLNRFMAMDITKRKWSKNERAIFHGDELPEGIESMASSGALTRGVCSEAPKQSFKPFFKALKESKSRGDWCLRCKSFIELLDVFLGTRFIRSPGLRILKGCLGLSKTVISGRLVHDWRG